MSIISAPVSTSSSTQPEPKLAGPSHSTPISSVSTVASTSRDVTSPKLQPGPSSSSTPISSRLKRKLDPAKGTSSGSEDPKRRARFVGEALVHFHPDCQLDSWSGSLKVMVKHHGQVHSSSWPRSFEVVIKVAHGFCPSL